ncbi:MAG: hypothetical protein ACYTHM_25095 [Planctomycetota bacterium]
MKNKPKRERESGRGRTRKKSWLPYIIGGAIVIGVAVTVVIFATLHFTKRQVIEGRLEAFVQAWNSGKVKECQTMYVYKKKKDMVGFDDLIKFIRKKRPNLEAPYEIELESLYKYYYKEKHQHRARAHFVLKADADNPKKIIIKSIWVKRGGYGWFVYSWGAKETGN